MLALAQGARHGYAIKQEVEARTNGAIRLGPSTFAVVSRRARGAAAPHCHVQIRGGSTNDRDVQFRGLRTASLAKPG